jgi:hypothetical protein
MRPVDPDELQSQVDRRVAIGGRIAQEKDPLRPISPRLEQLAADLRLVARRIPAASFTTQSSTEVALSAASLRQTGGMNPAANVLRQV